MIIYIYAYIYSTIFLNDGIEKCINDYTYVFIHTFTHSIELLFATYLHDYA